MLQSFFFLWEIKNCYHIIQITGKSADTIKIEYGETDSIETCKGKETFTVWAKTCVIALWNFCLLVWNFYTKLVPSLIKEVDTLSYRPVRPEFFVPVDEPVQKHLQSVQLKIPAVPEYTGRFGRKRKIWPVQKLKGKIEEMHDLNKPQCNKLLLPFSFLFFLLLVCCPSPLLWFLLFFAGQWTLLCGFSFFVLYLIWNFLRPFTRWKRWKLYIFFNERWAEWFSLSFFFQFWAPRYVMH